MTESRASEAVEVVVEARDLDTDHRERVVLPALRPATARERERELRASIERVHPEAAFRSFARDVATALGPQHLIVAHYIVAESPPEGDEEAIYEQPISQGELFAA